jgi:hypothetical protein
MSNDKYQKADREIIDYGCQPRETFLILFAEPRLTRHSVKWHPLQKLQINRLIAAHDLLRGYSFDNSSLPWEGG